MAKKIRLDFSKTEERSGWNTKHITEGLHKMKVESVQETEAQDGTAMLVYALVPADPKLKTRRFPFYCKLQQNQLWKLRDLLVAAGISVPKKAQMIDPSGPVGKFIAAEVEDDTYQGNLRSSVNGTYGLDILDEDDSAGSEPDEDEEYDEEEYEDEAEAEDDSDEEYEDDEDEEYEEDADDDLDEDDLDDEELEDEDYEDDEEDEEEEEPEPAPRKRAPAKKATAKAAPARKAAPAAKRTVKRR
ncbi:hypothetical protein PBI_LUCKY3_33 [Microbacterium phage Lucky3]|uniref:Uncharacterized protein n=2 Tax=Kojivirus golden TaxID=2560590 RepID=A0A2P1CFU0_9CAUD|nr:hypothetical protein FDJ42_gp33 [Microbacterium phage Golden]AVJ49780.1 hypothetical protein PBI_GOLDEN_33 [Microbacterium phage Golden]AVJ50090.1 hypothetical protein PBI_LUCKY3_33 [Microbacterium phage Lucky3]